VDAADLRLARICEDGGGELDLVLGKRMAELKSGVG
jgi:hypothetical protein